MSGRITKSGSRRDLVSYKREWSPSLARALLETDKPGSGEFRSAPTPCNSPTSSSGRPIRGGRAARALYTGSMSRRARSEPYPGRGAFQFVGPASPSHDAKWKAKYEGRDGVERRMFAAKSNTGVESSRQSSVVCEQFKKEDAFKAKPTVVPPIFLGVGNSFETNSSQIGNVDWRHLEDSRLSLPLPYFTVPNMKSSSTGTTACWECEKEELLELVVVNPSESHVEVNQAGDTNEATSNDPDLHPAAAMEKAEDPDVDDLDILNLTIDEKEIAEDGWIFQNFD